MKFKFLLYLLLVSLFIPIPGRADNFPPISYLGIEQGLSNNAVRTIFQDHKGFMWFGTYDGLNKYDGYSFKVFRNEFSNPVSLVNNWVNCINEDATGHLWIGTRKGISIYNPLDEHFANVSFIPVGGQTPVLFTGVTKDILVNPKGHIAVATEKNGLLIGSDQAGIVQQIPLLLNNQPVTNYHVETLKTVSGDSVLMVIQNVGICLFSFKSNHIQVLNNTVKDASCIEQQQGIFWIGSSNGITLYNFSLNKCTPASAVSEDLAIDKVIDILADKHNNIWIATNGDGLAIYNIGNKHTTYLKAADKQALSSNAVYALFEDKQARIWIGTIRGGVNIIDAQKNRFRIVTHDPANANSLINNFILSLYESNNGNLWIGTDGGGLSVWNRALNKFTNYKNNPSDPSSLSDNFILNIEQDAGGDTWIATYYGGVNKCAAEGSIFNHYRLYDAADSALKLLTYSLCIDKENRVWVGTLSVGGLYLFDRDKNNFTLFDSKLKDLFVIKEDTRGQLWGGNLSQLIRIDAKFKQHEFVNVGQPVRCIAEDQQHMLWAGTEGGGLICYDPEQHKIIKRFTTQQGLCNNAVLTILPDSQGHLWMSTFNGISRFDMATESFKNYYQNDGLQSNQFNYNAGLVLRSGEFVFGGIKGLNFFYPALIQAVNKVTPVVLTDLLINNTKPGDDADFKIGENGSEINQITVPYDKAVFSFGFAALEYTVPEKISYSYYMEGWDKGWNNAGNSRKAVYTHLDEGQYTFRVKSTNIEGGPPAEIQLSIIVLPPWYRSWWAYLLYAAVLATAVYYYNQYRVRQSRLKYEVTIANLNTDREREKSAKEKAERERQQVELELEKAERQRQHVELELEKAERHREHAESEQERLEHEKEQAKFGQERAAHEMERVINEREKEINDKKLQFFTNVAHEFRTPLTLIINPVKDLIQNSKNDDSATTGNELKIVYRNARRMISLVDQLLLFQKQESGMDELRPEKLNFYHLCSEVYMSFLQQAKSKHIDYAFRCENQALEIWADRVKLEMILYNLFSNALKYTPAGGKIAAAINEQAESIDLLVTDNGRGIPPGIGEKIFDRFYQVANNSDKGLLGFGIGLYLVKQFVQLHKGTISYSSELGTGTTFKLNFLKGNNHFEPGSLLDDALKEDAKPERTAITSITHIESINEVADISADKDQLFTEEKIILVIDDDEQMLEYVSGIFKTRFTVLNAANGIDGLKLAQKSLPDIIISDIRMEGINGIELCKTIKQDSITSHIPVILLTGTSSPETRLESIEGGADDYIIKPFEKEILVARVESLLKNRTALQNYFYNEITLQKNELKVSAEYKDFIERCIRIVEENLDEEEFGVQAMIKKIGMSRSSLFRKVKSVSGLSIISFIRFIRLRKAAELFINSDLNVTETAIQVGISDLKYFRKQFQKLFGLNPSEYITRYRKVFNDKYNINKDKFGLE